MLCFVGTEAECEEEDDRLMENVPELTEGENNDDDDCVKHDEETGINKENDNTDKEGDTKVVKGRRKRIAEVSNVLQKWVF